MAAGELTDAEVFAPVREFTDAEVFRPARINPNLAAQGAKAEGFREVSEFMSSRDPGIDYKTGVPNALFRAAFSRMSNDAEKAKFLDEKIGKDSWGKDSFGAYFLKPEGLSRFGIKTDKPVSIDEQKATLYDVADVAGDVPSIAGAVAGGMAASGAGLAPGLAAAGLGAATGKALDEVVKNVQGQQVKTPSEVAKTLATEAGMGAVGEGAARIIAPVVKFGMGPGASRMTPERKQAADDAIAQGFKIRAGSVTDAPLLARFEGMTRMIFGDLYKEQNEAAAKSGMAKLSGAPTSKEEAGRAVSNSIKAARVQFGEDMAGRYAEVDRLAGNTPIIPTGPMKAKAEEILAAMPQTSDGKVVGGKDALLRDIMKMGDAMTVSQAQRLRTMLREASESPDLVPDIAMHEARVLKKSIDEAFETAANAHVGMEINKAKAVNALRSADAAYREGIRRFDNPVVAAITRDASRGGSVDADMVVDYLIKPERIVRLRQVKNIVPEAEWKKVQSAHSQELLSNLVRGTDDPLQRVFDGRAFRDTLEEYGRPLLEEVHGREWVDAAYKYANAMMLAEKKMKQSGGIVAANIALHPVKNLPRLVWIRAMSKVMGSPKTFKYLTEGIQTGPSTQVAAAGINRLLNETAALARDETGSAKFVVTEPK